MPTVAELIGQIRLLPSQDQRHLLKELQVLVEKELNEEQEIDDPNNSGTPREGVGSANEPRTP
jgi:hypothetical protein